MKNLAKLLPLLLLPFIPLKSKAQEQYIQEDLPFDCVPHEFLGYQNKNLIFKGATEPQYFRDLGYVFGIGWDFDKDTLVDVVEIYPLRVTENWNLESTFYPGAYLFFPGDQDEYYEEWVDKFADGLNCNEYSLKRYQREERVKRLQERLEEWEFPMSNPARKVDI